MAEASLRVSALYTYPIKSCAGLTHAEILLDQRGPVFDRRWMVVADSDLMRGIFLTQRELPRMALIRPHFGIDSLRVDAPDRPTLDVSLAEHGGRSLDVVIWKDATKGLDEGDEAAAWFSDFLETPVRLVRMAEATVRPVSLHYTDQSAQVSFADGYPLLLTTDASLEDLNARMIRRGEQPVPMNRFRPNVVVSGAEPFEEDTWHEITIGAIPFEVCKPCARCSIPTVDQARGDAPDVREPTATLATFRRTSESKVMFGQNVIHRGLGTLCVGDRVTVQTVRPVRMELVKR